MKYYELVVTTKLNVTVDYKDQAEFIGKQINKSLLGDEYLKERHTKNTFKHYVFSGFYPVEPRKPSLADHVYVFRIRSMSKRIALGLKKCLENFKTDEIQVLAVQVIEKSRKHIKQLYTLTPAIMTISPKNHWIVGQDIDLLLTAINNNLKRKHKDLYGKEIPDHVDIIKSIEIINEMPIILNYKEGKMFCNKFRILVNEDPYSQMLATIALGSGLLEKNSAIGCGFCLAD